MLKSALPLCRAGALGAALAIAHVLIAPPAHAHPHVWVTAKAEVIVANGAVTALRHTWTFDEFYTAMAVQGLDTNNDGIYSKEELAELAKVNMEGLAEFDYFTHARQGTTALKFAAPKDPWLEHANGILSLHFDLPLAAPVSLAKEPFSFAVYDQTAFIAFEYAKSDPITLSAGTPSECKLSMANVEPSAEEKSLAGAFSQALGTSNAGGAKSAVLTCAKS